MTESTENVKELLHKILALLEGYTENDCQVALGMASFYLMQKSKEKDDPTTNKKRNIPTADG
jgi:uncharacterized protein with ATP-grasp and redox domains